MRTIALLFIGALALPYSSAAHADYGQDGLAIRCDRRSQTFELNLFELWNEELDAYFEANPSGLLEKDRRVIKVFSDNRDEDFSATCQLKRRAIVVRLENGLLSIASNGEAIAKREAYYLWVDLGRVYGIRWSKKSGWQECSGASVGLEANDYECMSAKLPIVVMQQGSER